MSTRVYHVYHMNSEQRTVAVTMIVANSRKAAIRDAMVDAIRWNVLETRPNMVTHFITCEGLREEVKANLFTAKQPLTQDAQDGEVK